MGRLWSFLSIATFVTLLGLNFVADERITSTSKILASAWESTLIVQFLVLLSAKIHQFVKQKSIVDFFEVIDQFDRKVHVLCISNI